MPSSNDTVETLFAKDPAMNGLGFELIDSGPGMATLALQVSEPHLNFNGTCHGGIVFALADSAFGLAANSHGTVAAGINANIAYHKATRLGDKLIARARETTRSTRLASYIVEVLRNESQVVATFSGTAFITADQHDIDGHQSAY